MAEGLVKVPMIGAWEGEVVQYTEYLDNAEKTKNLRPGGPGLNLAELQKSQDVGRGPAVISHEGEGRPSSAPQTPAHSKANVQHGTGAGRRNQAEDLAKVPMFGDWEGGEVVQNTEYFEKVTKTKNMRPGLKLAEPQMIRDGRGPAVAKQEGQGRPSSVAQAPAHQKDNLQPGTGAGRRNQAASIPDFDPWDIDDFKAEGYTMSLSSVRKNAMMQTSRNYGKAPLISANFDECARPLPPVNEDSYGRGKRTMYDQRGSESIDQMGNANQVYGASTPQNPLPTILTPEQRPTKKKRSRFYWFRR